MSSIDLSLSFGREVYSCGGLCTALLSLSNNTDITTDSNTDNNTNNTNNTTNTIDNNTNDNNTKGYSIYIQSLGHIQVDSRWIKEDTNQCTNIFKQELLVLHNMNINKLPKLDNKSYYIFATSRKKYISNNCNDEICIYFDLPNDLLPSYKGLCAVISYYINITILNQKTGEKRIFQYPYQIVGKSIPSIVSYPIRYSDLVIIPSQLWPKDLHLQPLPDMLSVGFDDFSISNDDDDDLVPVVYNIRDEDIVCSLTLLQNKSSDLCIKMYPYQVVCLTLDFHLAKQQCNAVRSRLIQYEKKTDGSRVQDKVLYSITKSTKDALTVHMQLQSPPGLPCEFTTPVFKLSYMIELEFLIEKKGAIQSDPFTWNIPVEIVIPSGINNISAEMNACMEPVVVHNTMLVI